MQEQAKKIKLWPIVVLILFILLLIGSTFAIFTLSLNSQKLNIIKAGDLSMTLDDTTSSGIKLVNAVPMSYQQGMETVEYTFTLKNDGSTNNDYSISLVDENTYINDNNEEVTITEESRLEDTKIRYILLKDGEEAEASKSKLLSDATDRVIDSGTINSKGEITYSLRIWIDSKAGSEVMNKIFMAKLRIDAHQHEEVTVAKLCKRATELHTEICSNGDTSGFCQADGYSSGATIQYGNETVTEGELNTGDAFDCDIDGDKLYGEKDETTGKYAERFYYVTDMDENTAVLVYYNNVSGGVADNTKTYAYDLSGVNNNGPVTAIEQLPTTTQWKNASLTNSIRAITNESGGSTTIAGDLPTAFSYDNKAARLLTYQEVDTACFNGTTAITSTKGLSSKCKYLMENTNYSNSLLRAYGTWLETPRTSYSNLARIVYGKYRSVDYVTVITASQYGVRPAIEVAKTNIEY